METKKAPQIPYGISDFVRMRTENYYYVDKTMYLPMIEDFPHPWRHAHLSDICSTHESDPHPAMAKEEKSSLVHAQDLSKIEQTGLSKQAKGVLLAPSADKLKAIVWINGEEVPVLMKQEIKEYFDATEYGNAYLLTVDMPRHQKIFSPTEYLK